MRLNFWQEQYVREKKMNFEIILDYSPKVCLRLKFSLKTQFKKITIEYIFSLPFKLLQREF